MNGELPPEEFEALERRAARAAERLLDDFIIDLSRVDTDTLRAIADYREAIRPGDWITRCIREYMEVWR